MVATPFKFDLLLSTESPLLVGESYGLSMLGNLLDTIVNYVEIAKNWASNEHLTSINRIGFGVDLFHRVSSLEEGYKTISELQPLKVDAKTTSDFRLQINKFMHSKIDKDLRINRLTNIAVLNLKMQIATAVNPNIPVNYPDVNYCHMNIDVNTAQEYNGEFDKNKTLSLFDELVSQAIKISKEGVTNI